MKRIFLPAMALCCLPLLTLADEPARVTTTVAEQQTTEACTEEKEECQEEETKMHCVFATCTGTVCDKSFSDPNVRNNFIEQNDHCYDKYQ